MREQTYWIQFKRRNSNEIIGEFLADAVCIGNQLKVRNTKELNSFLRSTNMADVIMIYELAGQMQEPLLLASGE